MSWLTRSIANTLRLDDDDDDDDNVDNNPKDEPHHQQSDPSSPTTPGRGVKEDLSEFTKTLTRQFWGVASFLAPPAESQTTPPSQISDSSPHASKSDPEGSEVDAIFGMRSDIVEIGGRFRSGISKLSNNVAVSEFSKIASNFLQLGSEEDYSSSGSAIGVTDEVVAFAKDIAMHPETWLDFPLTDDDDDNEFDMSYAQQEHALAVEGLAPRLAALRIELCPGYMSEGFFWKIYFVLLHPRLNKHDAELLSTPQIVKARVMLTQELQNKTKTKPEQEWSGTVTSDLNDIANATNENVLSVPLTAQSESMPLETCAVKHATSAVDADWVTEKHAVQSPEIPIIDKSVVEEGSGNWAKGQDLHSGSSNRLLEEKDDDDDGDDWLKEESSETVGACVTTIPMENEEDVSFSDLEEDDGDVPTSYKKVTYGSDSSTKSRDWVQLSRSSTGSTKDINSVSVDHDQVSACNPETKDSNDWLNVDEIDVE